MKKLLILMVGISGLLVGCGAQEDMTSEPATTTDAAAVERLQKQRDTVNKLSDQRVKQAEQEQKTTQETGDKTRICEQARAQMAAYERPRVSVSEAGGQRVLGEEERLQGLEKARQKVAEWCK